jgi:hypothetical protein
MDFRSILTASALLGAITTAGVAHAGRDILGTAPLAADRGTVAFRFTTPHRTDGELRLDARGARILSFEIERTPSSEITEVRVEYEKAPQVDDARVELVQVAEEAKPRAAPIRRQGGPYYEYEYFYDERY